VKKRKEKIGKRKGVRIKGQRFKIFSFLFTLSSFHLSRLTNNFSFHQ
jgi:hypothetical protein